MKKWIKIGSITTAGVFAGAGIATGVILPMALKARNGLNNFLPAAGPSNMKKWNSNTKLNYVALGDSETAGYNGFLGSSTLPQFKDHADYISYADFLANDLKTSKHLNSYNNFAVSGARLADVQQAFGESATIQQALKKANLITLTLGANDLLAFVKILDLPFTSLFGGGLSGIFGGNDVKLNQFRDAIFGEFGNDKTNAGASAGFFADAFKQSIQELKTMISSGNYTNIITIQQKFKDAIFEIIKRNFALLIHDLHLLSPDSQIVVIGHAMPFAQWPTAVLNDKHPELDNKSIESDYIRMLNSMKDGAKLTTGGDDAYVTFKSVDKLPIYKSSASKRDKANNTFDSYIKHEDDYGKDFYKQNAMDDSEDIHPSTFGHELIGNSIYSFLSNNLGIIAPENSYTFSTPVKYDIHGQVDWSQSNATNFTRLDEDTAEHSVNGKLVKDINRSGSEQFYDLLRSSNSKNAKRSTTFGELNKNILGIQGAKTIDVLASIQDWSFFTQTLYDDEGYKLMKPIFSTMTSEPFTKTIGKLMLTLENQKDLVNPTSTPNDPSLTPIMDKILSNFANLANSIKVSKDVPKIVKDDLTALFTGLTGTINLLRVSKNTASDIASNEKLLNNSIMKITDMLQNPNLSTTTKKALEDLQALQFTLSGVTPENQLDTIKTVNKLISKL